jgi:hypothetical protein
MLSKIKDLISRPPVAYCVVLLSSTYAVVLVAALLSCTKQTSVTGGTNRAVTYLGRTCADGTDGHITPCLHAFRDEERKAICYTTDERGVFCLRDSQVCPSATGDSNGAFGDRK